MLLDDSAWKAAAKLNWTNSNQAARLRVDTYRYLQNAPLASCMMPTLGCAPVSARKDFQQHTPDCISFDQAYGFTGPA